MAEIVRISEPTIEPDVLTIDDIESDSQDNELIETPTSIIGNIMPYMIINQTVISHLSLNNFSMSMDEFIPKIKVNFEDSRDEFINIFYPQDGDVLSLFIRPNDINTYRPIRIDFDILELKSTLSKNVTITGQMKVPLLFSETNEFFFGTSFDGLSTIAQSLGLGFASNEDSTFDEMNWINPYNPRREWIGDITRASYKDEDSFFTSYVDPFYYLNFINVNKQFSEDQVEEETMLTFANLNEVARGESEGNVSAVPLLLSNHPTLQGTNSFIQQYTVMNKTGSIWIPNGYKRYAQFYDESLGEFQSQFVDPFVTNGNESLYRVQKGREDEEFYQDHNKYKYLGIQNDNVHINYKYSMINNLQNMTEINKIVLYVELESANFTLYKFQRVPILIFETDEENIKILKFRDEAQNSFDQDEINDKIWINNMLSGIYVVKDIEYVWNRNDSNIKQRIKLYRREWPLLFNRT